MVFKGVLEEKMSVVTQFNFYIFNITFTLNIIHEHLKKLLFSKYDYFLI